MNGGEDVGAAGDPAEFAAVVAGLLARVAAGEIPPVPEHVPEPEHKRLMPGIVWCMRCGRMLAADRRPDLDPNRKPCQVVKISLRAASMSPEPS